MIRPRYIDRLKLAGMSFPILMRLKSIIIVSCNVDMPTAWSIPEHSSKCSRY